MHELVIAHHKIMDTWLVNEAADEVLVPHDVSMATSFVPSVFCRWF